MANLTRDQVLQALRALSETDRTYVLAQLASSVSTAREASPGAAVQTTAGPVETTPDGLSELHKELASYRFAQGRFCPHCQSHEIGDREVWQDSPRDATLSLQGLRENFHGHLKDRVFPRQTSGAH